jgi:carbamoyl-phosphate synthase/aspartate carbamoyltransferase
MRASIQRVTFQDTTVCLDGEVLSVPPQGKDMSSHIIPPMSPPSKPTVSIAQTTDSPQARRLSMLGGLKPMTRLRPREGSAISTSPAKGGLEELAPALQLQPLISSSIQQLLSQPSSFKNTHVLSVKSYSRADLHLLFTLAQEMRLGVQREGVLNILRGRVLTTLFYEPSTRTSASFDAAMQRLGGRTVNVATSHSSVQKGESLQDTIRTLACYGDAVVVRHPDENSVAVAQKYSPVPVINAGNGSKEHPTQAFLDLFTIREELGTVQGLTITFLGDLLYGRPVHSLVYLLRHYHVQVQLVAPKSLQLPPKVREQLIASGQLLSESEVLTPEILARSDVLYCTRVQRERFPSEEEYQRVKNSYRVDNASLKHAKSSMVVMHPLPRNEEVAEEVDFDQRAAYFRQMRYGLYCRMALLALVMADS